MSDEDTQETENLSDLLSYLFTLKITENERDLLVEKIDKLNDVYINRIKELQFYKALENYIKKEIK